MKVVDIEYERRDPVDDGDLIGVGFMGGNCLFQFYPTHVNHWAESGMLKQVARFKITKLHNVRNK